MKNTIKRHSLLFFSIAFITVIAFSSASCDDEENGGVTITSNKIGTYDGYDYEFWTDSEAKGKMTVEKAGAFSCNWESTVAGRGNFLARSGKKFDSKKTHSQIGKISVKYNAAKYAPVGNGISYLCVYGWTKAGNGAPLVEYYIVDSWGDPNRPPGSWEENRVKKGTITVDDGTYDIWQSQRTNKPSIEGTSTFQQYWSVRQSKRTGGTISVSEHFKEWERLGMKLGNLYEVALCVEGYNSSGSAEITQNTLVIE
jgi:endo-1,4-beta-xylanase